MREEAEAEEASPPDDRARSLSLSLSLSRWSRVARVLSSASWLRYRKKQRSRAMESTRVAGSVLSLSSGSSFSDPRRTESSSVSAWNIVDIYI